MKRPLVLLLLLLAMVGFGVGVNRYIASKQTNLAQGPTERVSDTKPQVSIPGTIYVSQRGGIYAIANNQITQLHLPSGGSWIQPTVLPDGSLLVIRRYASYSDLYHVTSGGQVLAQLTHNADPSVIQLNHWILWPTVTNNGKTVVFSADSPKPLPNVSYEVDFSVWSAPVDQQLTVADSGVTPGTQWSTPNPYTGGDTQPSIMPGNSGILYTSYASNALTGMYSEIYFQSSASATPTPLTTPQQDCGDGVISPNGLTVAMLCAGNSKQSVSLKVADLVNGSLTNVRAVASNCLCNSASWSPNGKDLLYFNATQANGYFGLWESKNAGAAGGPQPPTEITAPNVDLDATSAAAWYQAGVTAALASPPATASPSPSAS